MATAPSAKGWKEAAHQGTLIVKAEGEEKWQASWCVLDYKLSGPAIYLYKTVNDAAPHSSVSINGAKLQVYELSKTGGFAFSIERLPLPTMIFATKKREEMMEWLRLIKAAVSATNSQLAVGGPIRPLEGTSSGVVAAISPPPSPRGHARAANALADTVADAILQLRAPDVTAQAMNPWFDGLSMTDLACSALVDAVRVRGSNLVRLTEAQVEKLPESVDRPRGPADFFLLSALDARYFIVVSSGAPFVCFSTPLPPPASPRSASPSSAAAAVPTPPASAAAVANPPSPRPGPVTQANAAGGPARLSPLRAPVAAPRKVPPVAIGGSAGAGTATATPAAPGSASPLSPRTRPNMASPMKTQPSLTMGVLPTVAKETVASVARPSLPSHNTSDRSPRPGPIAAASGLAALTTPAPPPAANAPPPANNELGGAAATNPPSPRGKLKPTPLPATPTKEPSGTAAPATVAAPVVPTPVAVAVVAEPKVAESKSGSDIKSGSDTKSGSDIKPDTSSLRGNKPLPPVPRKQTSEREIAASAAAAVDSAAGAASPSSSTSPPPASSAAVAVPNARPASPAPPSSLSPRQHSPRKTDAPPISKHAESPPPKPSIDGSASPQAPIVSPREAPPLASSPSPVSALGGSLQLSGRDSTSSSWRSASSKDIARPASGPQGALKPAPAKPGLLFGKKTLPPAPGSGSPVATPPGSLIAPVKPPSARDPALTNSASTRGSALTGAVPPSGTTRERRRYYHSDFYDSSYLHTGGMDSKTTKVYL